MKSVTALILLFGVQTISAKFGGPLQLFKIGLDGGKALADCENEYKAATSGNNETAFVNFCNNHDLCGELYFCCRQSDPGVCESSQKAAGMTTATPDANLVGCASFNALFAACESTVSNFDNLDDEQEASCVCYSGTSWMPNTVDSYIAGCYSYAQTAVTGVSRSSDVAVFSSVLGFCSSLGDVRAASVTPTGTTSINPTGSKTASPGSSGATGSPSPTSSGNSTPSAGSPTLTSVREGSFVAGFGALVISIAFALALL